MSKVQVTDSFSNVSRLFRIERAGLTFANRAKSTMACTDVAAKHEGCGAIGPAFEDVGAARFLADGVQIESFDQLQHLVLIGWVTQADAQPFRLWLTDLLIVADYTEFAGQLFTSAAILRVLARRVKPIHRLHRFILRICVICG